MSNTTICIISRRSDLIISWLYNNYKENFWLKEKRVYQCKDKIITFTNPDYDHILIKGKATILDDCNCDATLLAQFIHLEKGCKISYNTLNEDILIAEIEK